MERDIRIAHHAAGNEPAYDIFIEGITPQPQLLTKDQLAPIIETIYREEAGARAVATDRDAGVQVDRRILTPVQERALRALTVAYQFLLRRNYAL